MEKLKKIVKLSLLFVSIILLVVFIAISSMVADRDFSEGRYILTKEENGIKTEYYITLDEEKGTLLFDTMTDGESTLQFVRAEFYYEIVDGCRLLWSETYEGEYQFAGWIDGFEFEAKGASSEVFINKSAKTLSTISTVFICISIAGILGSIISIAIDYSKKEKANAISQKQTNEIDFE